MKSTIKFQKIWAIALAVGLSFAVISCDDNDDPKTNTDKDLDATQVATLAQYVDNVVVTTYKNLADAALEMQNAVAKLHTEGGLTQENVKAACDTWIKARKYWEQSEAFLYGAAGDYNIDPHIDSWPLDKTQLDNLLANEKIMENFDADYAGENLAGGLLGFHAVEYVIFKEGAAKPVAEITANETKYAAGVSEDLARQAVRLEAAWAGVENLTAAKQKILEDTELEPTRNYGEELKAAGNSGNKKYPTLKAGFEEILGGAIGIADEVGNTKINDPVESGNVLDVESWYSWNSLTDFQDNIISIQNAYLGGVEGNRDEAKSVSAYIKTRNAALDTEVKAAIENAIKEIQTIGEPFRNHLNEADTKKAIEACNTLMSKLEAAKTAVADAK